VPERGILAPGLRLLFSRPGSLAMPANPKRPPSSFFLPAAERVADVPWHPSVDVYRTPHGWLIKFDLAGVRSEDVRLVARGSRLTVQGVRRDWGVEEGCRCYRMEISYSHFERTLELPGELDQARIRADYRDGMLVVHIDREDR
jgi:HSP20 family protein